MRMTARAHGLLMVAALLATSFAQQNSPTKALTKTPPAPAKPKLTEKQKQGLRMLDAAQTEAAALQPDMRAYIEWQAALGYQKYDPKKSDELLESAFNSTTALTSTKTGNCWTGKDEPCRVKHWLQSEILDEIAKRSPDKGKDLTLKLDPEMKQAVEYRLLRSYVEKKDVGAAKELLDSMAGEDGYPYREASEVMEAIPQARRPESIAIFSQALANYRQFNTQDYVDDGDFSAMLVRCWRQLPPAMATDAIDAILEKTKSDATKNPVSIMTAHHGDIRFDSAYALRVFELLPILRELDSTRADELLREQANLQATLKQYPNGMLSIDEKFGKQWSEKDDNLPEIVNMGEIGSNEAEEQEQQYLYEQDVKIWAEVAHDPKQALAMAYSLPEQTPRGHHPRMGAFLTIADRTLKKDPDVCRIALSETRKAIDTSKPMWATDQLLEVAGKYEELGDVDNAKSTLQEAVKNINQLYKEDSDVSDPNLAFKGNWPSTHLWGRCLRLAAQVSPETMEQMMSEVPDPEIMSFLKVMYANGLLGAARSNGIVAVIHKDGKNTYYGMR